MLLLIEANVRRINAQKQKKIKETFSAPRCSPSSWSSGVRSEMKRYHVSNLIMALTGTQTETGYPGQNGVLHGSGLRFMPLGHLCFLIPVACKDMAAHS